MRNLTIILSLFALSLPLVALLAPKGVVVAVVLAAVLGSLLVYREKGRLTRPNGPITLALVLFLLWCAVTVIWSHAPGEALARLLRVTALLIAGLLLLGLPALLGPDQRRGILLSLALGCALTLGLVVEELLFGFPLFDLLRGPAESAYASASRLNRGLAALTILAWPIAAAFCRAPRPYLALLPMAVLFIVLPFLENTAALLALALGLVSLLVALLHRQAGRILIGLSLILVVLGSPVGATLMGEIGLSSSVHLPVTARQRVEIWGATAARIAERPVAGWGFDASRHTRDQAMARQGAAKSGNQVLIPLHPHNAPLQILLELGFVGGILFAGLLWTIAAPLERLPRPHRLWGVGLFFTTLTIASLSFGIWQNQWLALILAAAFSFSLTVPPTVGVPKAR